VTVSSGELWVGHTSTGTSSTGDFEVVSGSVLGIKGANTMAAGSSISGAGGLVYFGSGTTAIQGGYTLTGPLEVKGGTLSFANAGNVGNITVTSGTLEFTQAVTVNADVLMSNGTLTPAGAMSISGMLEQNGGTLKGDGTVTVAGLFTWTRGTQEGGGETVANGGMMLTGTSVYDFKARTLTLNAASEWTDGTFRLWNAATVNNNALLDIKTDKDFQHTSGAVSSFNNNGALTKSAGAGVTQIGANFLNTDSIEVSSGSLSLTKEFEQASVGTLKVGIAGLASFDSYPVTGTATLDGTLDINLKGGYEPALGNTFEIMTFASRVGTFNTVDGLAIGNGKKFDVVYNAGDVTLEVVTDP